jgi:DNA mismatch repair protein MutS
MTTPMMQQYQDAKERHPGMLLLFRMGDFFELFGDDAEVAARVLGLTLTSRDKTIPMAGFPHHSLDTHLRKLLKAGHRVAVCDQVEDPALAKGLVRREVTRVVTPGTLTDEGLLDPRTANHLVAVTPHNAGLGLAWVELSTGQFCAADVSLNQLADELGRLAAAECLVSETDTANSPERIRQLSPATAVTPRPDWTFDLASARAALCHHFGVTTLAGFGFEDSQPCLAAAGALLLYLQETLKASLAHLSRLRPWRSERFLFLDEVTRRSLELIRTLRDGSRDGSLLAVVDRTVTPMGARLLQEWLVAPLAQRSAAEARLDAVAELKDDHGLRGDIRSALADAYDLQRLSARASTGRASPRDLAGVGRTLALLPRIKAKVTARRAALLRELEERLELCPDLREALDAALVDDPPLSPREGDLIRCGYDAALDELHAIARGGKDWIARYQAQEITRTNIPSLKVGFNKVFGYYIEITNAHASKVPSDYQRKQTLKNAERYITPDLKAYEEKVLSAEDKIKEREYELFLALRDRVAAQAGRLLQTAEVLATLDVLAGLAELASSRQYCRPELTDEPVLEVQDGRHPVLDQTLPPGTFVPNDARLGPSDGTLLLITGPNMAGKCIAADTLVFTDGGLCTLEELRPVTSLPGEFVTVRCEVKGIHGLASASHFYNGGKRVTRKVLTSLGFQLEGTQEHRVWVRFADGTEGWKQLAAVQPGDYVAIDRHLDLWGSEVALRHEHHPGHGNVKRYRLPSELTVDLAYLMGLLVGDGVLTRRQRFAFINTDPELIDAFKRIVWEQFGYQAIGRPGDDEYTVTSTEIRRYLADNGLSYRDAVGTEVPACIRRAPRHLVIAFLQGLFDTDGTADRRYGNPSVATASPRLARQVQMLLLNLGLIASLHVKPTRSNPCYSVSLYGEDAIQFHDLVGFRLPRKRERRARASTIRRPNKGGIPHLTPLLKSVQARIVAQPNKTVALKQVKSVNSIFYTYIPARRNVSYAKLGELIAYCRQSGVSCTELDSIHARRYLYDKVKSVTPGESQVYDLSVPEGNAYVAGGFVSHNSVYIRQVALLTLLAQIGSFVPARQARIGLVDRIFTRVGASDELSRAQSTFMVEMTEAANILNNATARSLVILDEIGRGTSTYDGVSLAWAITEYVHDQVGCRALFATHYHELAQLAERLPGLRNYHAEVREWKDEVIFVHKIVPGSADRSYGIHVARLAGVPAEVLDRAREVLADLEAHHVQAKTRRIRRRPTDARPTLFADLDEECSTAAAPQGEP